MDIIINIKTLPITIVGTYIDEDSQAYVKFKLENEFFFEIGPQQAWALDEGLAYLDQRLDLQERMEIVTVDCYDDVENFTRDPRVVRIARLIDNREADGLTLEDLKPGRVFPPEE